MEVTNQRIVHAHDAFVRTVMSDLRVAREFFIAHLPKDLLRATNLEKLVLQPRSYIDSVRKESTVDLLYRTTINENDAYFYLLVEHQSSPDEFMAFRLLKYTCNIMDAHLKNSKQKKLPLVYPMVIYHAEQLYPFSTDIKDLIDAPRELIEKYFLKPFQLIDLGIIDDQELKQHSWVGIMEFVLKHIFARDLLPYLQDIAQIMRRVVESGGEDFVSIVLQYAIEKGQLNKEEFFDIINQQISSDVGEKVMTIAEQIREETKLEIAEQLVAEGMPSSFIEKVTGVSAKQLEDLLA